MTQEEMIARARETYEGLCKMMDDKEIHYERDDAAMTVACRMQGDDLPISLDIRVDADRQMLSIFSHLPFQIQEDKRLDVALAVCAINDTLVDGSFDYNIGRGSMLFRMTQTFRGCRLSQDAFEYLVFCTCAMMDRFNDRFLMLSKGHLPLEKFLESV